MTGAAPWWGVPVIAGGFLLLGGILTFIYTYLNDRRKARLDDRRRFESDIIELYEKIDLAIDGLHNTVPEDSSDESMEEYRKKYWDIYMRILRADQRLRIIAPSSIWRVSSRIRRIAAQMEWGRSNRSTGLGMPDLVEAEEELLATLRRHLRIREESQLWLDRPIARKVVRNLPEEWQLRLGNRRRRSPG